MRRPTSVTGLEELGRQRLSSSFFMRDFLYSDIAAMHGLSNVPTDPGLAIAAGTRLCEDLLEPLQRLFGRIAIRSAYRSEEVNAFGNANGYNCASNEANFAGHIWDRRDKTGHMGATACIVVPSFWDRFQANGDWQRLAWWVHDHLPYSEMEFFPKVLGIQSDLERGAEATDQQLCRAPRNADQAGHGQSRRLTSGSMAGDRSG